MSRNRLSELFRPDDLTDPTRRKRLFREAGRNLLRDIREGYVTDGPGQIARLMEAAYQGATSGEPEQVRSRRLELVDVPRLSLDLLTSVKRLITKGYTYADESRGITVQRVKLDDPAAICFGLAPKVPGYPSTLSRDEWFNCSSIHVRHSNKSMGPLEKLGLFTRSRQGETTFSCMTEWGFELLVTGSTSQVEDRRSGSSSTIWTYRELMAPKKASAAYVEQTDTDDFGVED